MTNAARARALTPVSEQIAEIIQRVPGWTPAEQLAALYDLVLGVASLPGDVVEIGSWCGRSSVVLGSAVAASGGGRVWSVDLFPHRDDWVENEDGTYSFIVKLGDRTIRAPRVHTFWREPYERDVKPLYTRYASVLDAFNESVERFHLGEVIRPVRGDVEEFARTRAPGFACKLAFLDGDHSYESVCEDIRRIEPMLVGGAWLCFDDAFAGYEGVTRAIEDLVLDSPAYDLTAQLTRKLFVARRRPGA
jgi:hypothetical protein